jgi:SAM-dependent methyltransferase
VPEGWEWDETLFAGSAPYYDRGRIPYPPGLHDAFASIADLTGRPRLIDVGCGPGTVARVVADLVEEVVGVDPDGAMLAEAARLASAAGITNARWVNARAEELPDDLGRFRYATFAQSFHWMDRPRVARRIFAALEPGGAFVHVGGAEVRTPRPSTPLPHPAPPDDAIAALVRRFLGPVRRAGRGVLLHGSATGERSVLRAAGFEPAASTIVEGRQILVRTVDDVVANVFSMSGSAPHLFGTRLQEFEGELRALLEAAADAGLFSIQVPDLALVAYRRP